MAVGPGYVIRVPGVSQIGKLPKHADKATFQAAFLAASGAVPDEPFAIFDKGFHLIFGTFIVAGTFDHLAGNVADSLASFTNGYGFIAGAATSSGTVDTLVQAGGSFFRARTSTLGSPQTARFNRVLAFSGGDTYAPSAGGRVSGYAGLNGKFYVLGLFSTLSTGVSGLATRKDIAVFDPATFAFLSDQPIVPAASYEANVLVGDATNFYVGGRDLSAGTVVRLYKFDVATNTLAAGFTASATATSGFASVAKIAQDTTNNRIYLSGVFDHVNGVARTGIAAVDATTGALITTFNPVMTLSGAPAAGTAMTVDPVTGTVFVSVMADTINGNAFPGPPPFGFGSWLVAAFSPTGTLLFAVAPVVPGFFTSTIQAEDMLLAGSDLIIVGGFSAVGLYGGATTARTGLASISTTTGAVTGLNLALTSFSNPPGSPLRLVGSG